MARYHIKPNPMNGGDGYIVMDGTSEIEWQPTMDAAQQRVGELQEKFGYEAKMREDKALFDSLGIDTKQEVDLGPVHKLGFKFGRNRT